MRSKKTKIIAIIVIVLLVIVMPIITVMTNTEASIISRLINNINSKKNILPNISVELESVNYDFTKSEEVEVTYNIIPHEFIKNDEEEDNTSKNYIEEAMILVDLSNNMNECNRWPQVKSEIWNKLFNNEKLKDKDISYGVVGFNSRVVSTSDIDCNRLFNNTNREEKELLRRLFQEDKIGPNKFDQSRNLEVALRKACNIFDKKGMANKSRAIVLITSGKMECSNEIINEVKLRGYKIITVDMCDGNEEIKNIHKQLGGENKDYFISERDNKQADPNGSFNNVKIDMENVSNSLLAGKTELNNSTFIINDAQLNFDLGECFSHISGLDKSNGNNKYKFNLGKIEYNKHENKDGSYTYKADSIKVAFKIKINSDMEGELTFKEPNNVEYNNITYNINENNTITQLIDTPRINIDKIKDEMNLADLKILEIQPDNNFILSEKANASTGIERIKLLQKNNEYYVDVEHITMTEFVGKVDKINGKYDVIVLGRNKTENKAEGDVIYSDYSNIRENDNNIENDITNRKAKEIIDYIESGQLGYIDESIVSSDSDLKNTKLFKNLGGNIKNNFKIIDTKNLDVKSIVEDYLSIKDNYKRPSLNIISKPIGENYDEQPIKENRNMDYELSLNSPFEQDIIINLYLDINGDGLFKEEEIVKTEKVSIPQENYMFSYTMDRDFIGYLDWKMEVVTYNNIKAYETGNLLFRSLSGKKIVRVLQVSPYKNLNDGSIDNNYDKTPLILSTDNKGNKNFNNLLKQVKDYEIQIETITVDKFKENAGKEIKLNGQYDMLILGFGDTYNKQSFDKHDNVTNEIKEFISTGQGVMLTHDTLWLQQKDKKDYMDSFVKTFRGIAGQDRYCFNSAKENNIYDEDKNVIGKTIWRDIGPNKSQTNKVNQINSAIITKYPFDLDKEEENNMLSVRTTHGQWFQLNLEDEDVVPWYTLTNNRIVNQYDVRNNYYTYSKGNITFSGTGENSKDKLAYPDSELKLFINTIIKASRGANHAPTTEVLNLDEGMKVSKTQDKLDFSIIPKDIDGDLIDVNIKVEGKASNNSWQEIKLDNIKLSFKDIKSNSILNVTLENKLYKMYEKIKVTVSAIDSRGAKAQDIIRTINIVDYPLLEINTSARDAGYLVGDDIDLKVSVKSINQEKINENNKSKYTNIQYKLSDIAIDNLISRDNTILNFKNIEDYKEHIEEKKYKINISEGFVATTDSIREYIIKGKYTYLINSKDKISRERDTAIKVKKGQILAKAFYNDTNVKISPKVYLKDMDGKLKSQGNIKASDGKYTFDIIPTGTYKVEVDLKDLQDKGYTVDRNSKEVVINFENNVQEVKFDIVPLVKDLRHGLYEGIDDGKVNIDTTNNKEFIANTNINFASEFKLNGNAKAVLELDNNGVVNNEPKVFKFENNHLIELENITVSKINNNIYEYDIRDIKSETQIVIIYGYKIFQGVEVDKITNTVKVSTSKADAIIKVKKDSNGNDIILPDLF